MAREKREKKHNDDDDNNKKHLHSKVDPVIVLTASTFTRRTVSANQYVDNESNQAVMGMTFWTKKEVSVLVAGDALAIDLRTSAPR